MSPKRIKQRFDDFQNALKRLKEVLDEDPSLTSAIFDAAIQRFEFTFELAWKLARDILLFNGVEANNPRTVVKELFKEGYIAEGEKWLSMLEDRNRTTHIYDESEAKVIYQKIKECYFDLLAALSKKFLPIVSELKEK